MKFDAKNMNQYETQLGSKGILGNAKQTIFRS